MKAETRVGIFVVGALAVFIYLSFNMGAFRMDHTNYDTYVTYFDDTGGLEVDAIVKASGVKIGRVASVTLRPSGKAEVQLKIHKAYKLALNAYAVIQQESLLGQKSIEIDQGDFATGILPPGSTLAMPGRTSASIGELIDQFRDIAYNVGDIASSFKETFASEEGRAKLHSVLDNASDAAKNFSHVARSVEDIINDKHAVIMQGLDDFGNVLASLKRSIPTLEDTVFPAVSKVGPAAEAVKNSFEAIEEVAQKINRGDGLVGKLVTSDETYDDIKKTVRGVRDYVSRMQSVQLIVDMHNETLLKELEGKGYCELRIRPRDDYFYMLQIVSDEFGSLRRVSYDYRRYTETGERILTSLITDPAERVEFADHVEVIERVRNTYHIGFQFGKRFDRVTLRVGLFEGAVGCALDFYVPLKTHWFHWITSLEAFDFRGVKRIDDDRPHLKWINKVHFLRNLYTCFGIDDFISRENARPFYGVGLKFTDDDLKYFIGMFSGFKPA